MRGAYPSGRASTLARQMEQATLIPTKCFVRDLADGQEVDSIFVVRARNRRQKRNGEPFLKMQLGDATGSVEAVVWDGVDELDGLCEGGSVVRVLGRYSVDERYGRGITIRRMRAAQEGEYELVDLAEAPPIPYRQMAADLQSLVETVQRPHLRELLDRLIDDAYHEAPAAKYYRDIAVTGALLHDIGKVETYSWSTGAIELTDAGKLLGEIPLGYYRVRREIEGIEGFPRADAEALLHIILSHHGKLEHGSPVVPCTREATLVHFIDNLGGNLGSFDRIEKALAEGATWSDFDRGLSTAAYFAAREQAA